jgi:3-phytase
MFAAMIASALILVGLAVRAQPLKLEYWSDTEISTRTKFGGEELGGLSSLSYDPTAHLFYAISDDRGDKADYRYYRLSLDFNKDRSVNAVPKSFQFLKSKGGAAFAAGELDLEGMAPLGHGRWVLSSEGDNRPRPRIMPRLLLVGENGQALKDFELPNSLLPERSDVQTKGIRNNSGGEGLSVTPDGKTLFLAIENSLVQDGEEAQFNKGTRTRILQYDVKGDELVLRAEYAYPLEGIVTTRTDAVMAINGVSEILALSDTELLLIERGGTISKTGTFTAQCRIFQVNLAGATNFKGQMKMPVANLRLATKELLINFDTIKDKFKSRKIIDNFEGFAFGPKLPGGQRSLVVVSDNNFSKKQTTMFVVFAVDDGMIKK